MTGQNIHRRRIRDTIAGDITAGRLAEGAVLPTQQDLARDFAVSRHHVRKALEDLVAQGWIEGWQGRGYCVRRREWSYPITTQTKLAASLRAAGASVEISVLRSRWSRPGDAQIGTWLGLTGAARVPTAEILHRANGQPIAIGRHYFHPHRFADILPVFCAHGSAPRALADHGITEYTRSDTVIRTRLPGAEEALVLGIPRQQPVLRLSGRNVDPAGNPIEVTEAIVRGDAMHLMVVAPNPELGVNNS